MEAPTIYETELFSSVSSILASANETEVVEVAKFPTDGLFALAVDITGEGTAKIEYLCEVNGTYVVPDGAVDIVTAHVKTSGTGGKNYYSFSPPVCKRLQIKITETGGASALTVTSVKLIAQ